jgi:predicted metalloprotease
MRLDDLPESGNIDDRRGDGGGFGGGGMGGMPIGGGGLGIDPMQVLGGGGGLLDGTDGSGQITDNSGQGSGGQGTGAPANDEMKQFVSTILAETEDTWSGIFQAEGLKPYTDPKLLLFSGGVRSACGMTSSAAGPFYCPNDQKVYLDTDFFQQLSQQFGASGDFAEAYVIAHEVGHHVQNLTGILPKFNQMRQSMSEVEANHMSMQVELQADCFAGVWGHFTAQKGILEQGDLEEALNAAKQIGDDTLQKKMQGYVVPESFNHGTSAQRQKWFAAGLQSGKLSSCDTFNNPI